MGQTCVDRKLRLIGHKFGHCFFTDFICDSQFILLVKNSSILSKEMWQTRTRLRDKGEDGIRTFHSVPKHLPEFVHVSVGQVIKLFQNDVRKVS